MSNPGQIEQAALRLPEAERLRLAASLLDSVPSPSPLSPDEIAAEALARDSAVESGNTPPINEDAFWAGVRQARSEPRVSS